MDSETLKAGSGYLLATFLTTVGLGTLVNPIGRSQLFGVTAGPNDKAVLAYIQAIAARDLSLGLGMGALMFQGEQKSAGLVALIALANPAIDAWVAWKFNGRLKEAWPHIYGVGICVAVGVWLIGN